MNLPPLYDRWLVSALGASVPGEARSDCASCPACAPGNPGPRFHPDVRCCGHVPTQPNFIVGAILAEGTARDVVRARLPMSEAVTPLGLAPTPAESAALSATPFGADPALACPYLDAGRCRAWRHREAICATWFCRLDRGALGQRLQVELRALLQHIEQALSLHLARELGARPERRGASAWGPWAGREEAYFVACGARAVTLSWSEVRRIGGDEVDTRVRTLRARLAERMDERAPAGSYARADRPWEPLPDGRVLVRTWSPWDPVVLEAEERAWIEAGNFGRFEGARLRALVDHHVLVVTAAA